MPKLSLRLIGIAFVSFAAALILSGPIRGQLKPQPAKDVKAEETKFTEAVTLPRNPESKRLIQAAQDYVKKQEWRIAGECLQSLLETPEDSFIEVSRKNQRGQDVTVRVSVRAEANRIIGQLPPDGLESYQVQYGQVAYERLKEAVEKADPALLAEISQRYFNTKPGQEATDLLGTYQLDRGQHLMASLCFERLLSRADADKLPARVLFKAALAFRRAGNTTAAERTFARFADQYGREQSQKNTRITLEQFRSEFGRDIGSDVFVTSNDWPVFRGNAARVAQCRGSTAYLEPRWTAKLTRPDATVLKGDQPAVDWIEQHLDQATMLMRDKPILPASFPIAANGKLFVRSYDGIAAYALNDHVVANKKTGDLLWRTKVDNSLFSILREDNTGKQQKLQEWYTNHYLAHNAGPVGVLFENSVLGAISHDGQRVYFIDDIPVPPHPSQMRSHAAFGGMPMNFAPFANEVNCNRLCAANIEKEGAICWSPKGLGGKSGGTRGPPADGRGDLNAATELQDTFFLGPPLPLGGKLYLLTEKQSELRLICLDPNKLVPSAVDAKETVPELVWIQSLGTANEKLPLDGQRRMQAAHLAYGDGILVCPTNAGAVVGVDLLSHSLVWAFSYRKVQQATNPDEMMMFNRGLRGVNRGPTIGERWRPSAPCIVKGKVLITAPDSGDLHCLNLRDGQSLWSVKRDDADLYFAGAFDDRAVIVSKNHVRLLNVDTGKEVGKRIETGLPSGQGVAAEGTYYLPLAVSNDTKSADKGAEICAIDLKSGTIVGRSKSRKEIPGNLLFLEGELIAQTVRTVSSFPLLKVKQEEINAAIAKNPNDPKGLTERGELHLYNGAAREAVADLRLGLANQPAADVKTKARRKLHEALTILFKDDFAGAEQYLAEYAELCEVDAVADADLDAKQNARTERIRRQAVYLELLGRGRERQGRLLDAFAAYEQYSELSGHKELVDSVDEPSIKARPDIWSRGRIQSLLNGANDPDRKKLEGEITKRWASVQAAANLDGLRKFVALYGPISASGKAARLQLAEQLLATGDSDDLTEAERVLATLCLAGRERRDDPLAAGRATDLMIRVCLRRGRYENAVGYCRQLADEFPDVPVRDRMTGREVWEAMSTDKRFLPYLETPTAIWTGPLTGKVHPGNYAHRETSITLQPQGDLLPFFARHRLALDIRQDGGLGIGALRMLDRGTGEERWRIGNIPHGNFVQPGQVASPYVHARGNLLILQANEFVIAADVSERKELWRYNLLGKDAKYSNDVNQTRVFDAMANNVFVTSTDEKKVSVGRVAVVEATYVAVQGRDGLVVLDATRHGASKLWIKSDVSNKASVFGDDRHIFIFDRDAQDGRPKCQALRAQDGMPVKCGDFAEFYKKKLRTIGGQILLADESGRALRLVDALSCREIWHRDFPANTVTVKTDDRSVGAINPDGRFTLFNVEDGAIRLESQLGAERVLKLQDATLLDDRDRYYLVLNRRPEGNPEWSCAVASVQSVKFNGHVIAVNRQSGRLEWATEKMLPHQALVIDQWRDLPVLVCASAYFKKNANNNPEAQGVRVTVIDKATGKLIFDPTMVQSTHFHSMTANPTLGKIEITRQDAKIVLATAEAALLPEPARRDLPRPIRAVPIPVVPAPAAPGGR